MKILGKQTHLHLAAPTPANSCFQRALVDCMPSEHHIAAQQTRAEVDRLGYSCHQEVEIDKRLGQTQGHETMFAKTHSSNM